MARSKRKTLGRITATKTVADRHQKNARQRLADAAVAAYRMAGLVHKNQQPTTALQKLLDDSSPLFDSASFRLKLFPRGANRKGRRPPPSLFCTAYGVTHAEYHAACTRSGAQSSKTHNGRTLCTPEERSLVAEFLGSMSGMNCSRTRNDALELIDELLAVQAVRDLLVPPGLTPYIASTPASTSTLAPATAASSPTVSFTKGELPKALAATKGVTDPYGWSGELLASIYRIKEHFSQVLGPRQGSTSNPTAPPDGDAPQCPTTATGGPQVALNKIFHHIANNTVPESIRHALCSINYTILEKANGKFRPVGTDSIFNKVVNRALLEQQQPHIAHLLQASPELAVGVKDGISAAVGMAFGELQACESTPGWTMLSLDFKSAFNYTDRARLHEIVADKPSLLCSSCCGNACRRHCHIFSPYDRGFVSIGAL
ncbi:uncharacterized protein MONBRDRAFT_13049 [Monosiga brevicollis MX1]|uniref:Reverse transcriptase domain-containing protein n=1 Tax=Monosiga brevicollis TaxID=81824 RepID=A9VE40_MONBE|nr:uncharacterized protein MONBRDRAFT_13049 [Monosiga brevicollis MX1]EDQ84197.1 predicted protein [Monosiga brevicollis MX1]|eukprot:XP_001750985.1 hypothetical protein [Monosiga brevicollis MX1]